MIVLRSATLLPWLSCNGSRGVSRIKVHGRIWWMEPFCLYPKSIEEERTRPWHIYMDAGKAMGLQGGWPQMSSWCQSKNPFMAHLFPNTQWKKSASPILPDASEEARRSVAGKAAELWQTHWIQRRWKIWKLCASSGFRSRLNCRSDRKLIRTMIPEWGGMNRIPNFRMACQSGFCPRLCTFKQGMKNLREVFLPSKDGKWVGIYESVKRWLSRFSVDGEWLLPNFRKMGYDNGQLVEFFQKRIRFSQDPLSYEKVSENSCLGSRSKLQEEGGFHFRPRGRSEGWKGNFTHGGPYCELAEIYSRRHALFSKLYNLKPNGNLGRSGSISYSKPSPIQRWLLSLGCRNQILSQG